MACGIPVIVARNTGMLDILTDENCIPLHRQSPVLAIDEVGTDGWGESDIEEVFEALEFSYQNRVAAAATGARARQYRIENGRTAKQHAANFEQWLIDNGA